MESGTKVTEESEREVFIRRNQYQYVTCNQMVEYLS